MNGKARGQPLVALLAVLGGWIGGRAAGWEAPVSRDDAAYSSSAYGQSQLAPYGYGNGYLVDARGGAQSLPGSLPATPGQMLPPAYGAPYPQGYAAGYGPVYGGYPPTYVLPGSMGMPMPAAGAPVLRPLVMWESGQNGWGPSALTLMPSARPPRDEMAGVAAAPPFYAPGAIAVGANGAAATPAPAKPRRWSADSWALLRRGSGGTLSPGFTPATYGASQAGAVMRYRLDMTSRYRPTAYLRTTSTMGQPSEVTAAIGLSARPMPAVPVVAAIEGRMTQQGILRRFQPAVLAYTELPPFALPGGMRGEAYLQGGYVGGQFATLFADGQVRVDHGLLRLGAIESRVGGGVWGGVQKGAARLDAGPSASIAMPLGKGTFGRVALDWRFRVAGNALPGSGPAVTLSAGF